MIDFLIFTAVCIILLWVCFIALFNWMPEYTKAQKGPWYWYAFAVPGVILDLFINFYVGSIIFLQPPSLNRGFLSARMDDLILNGSGWRQWLAIQIVGIFLERFDKTGQHTTHNKGAFANGTAKQ